MGVDWRLPYAPHRDQRCPMCFARLDELTDQCRTFRGKRFHVLECPLCHHREVAVEVIGKE